MTSPMSFMPTLPQEGSRLQRDDEQLPLPSRGAPARTLRDATTMDGANAQDQTCLRHGQSATVFASQSPQRHLVLPDPLAFRFLEEDPCVTVVERRCALTGYELYVVEQWACSRQSPIVVVTTYTGDERQSIVVGVLSIPEHQLHWSARLRLYFKAASQHNARAKHTELGELMITNLSSFPSALTVISVPDGDVRKNRQLFIVNEDLKRLGCSGRSGLALADPTDVTQAKFHQLYKISQGLPILQSVMELIKLCQIALYMFEKLDHQYIDGLLCDVTERGIGNWWTEVGAEHYNFEPTDGILGPSTVSALLGMLMGARNRLHWFGAPVSKDVFDIEATKRGIAYFQKQQKLDKTRRLDRQTVFRLHTATAKGAAGEGWGVQKAVKSTVTEIGGKRGEIVLDMVSGKDRGGLADIETLDMDIFVSLAYGDRPRWLWHGKARRSGNDDFGFGVQDLGSMLLGRNEAATHTPKRSQTLPLEEEPDARRREDGSAAGPYSGAPPGSTNSIVDASGEKDALRKGVFKSVTEKMSDARSGLGRIKDAVGGNRRGHMSKPSLSVKEDFPDARSSSLAVSPIVENGAMVQSPTMVARAFTWRNKPEEYPAGIKRDQDVLSGRGVVDEQPPGASAQRLKPDENRGDEPLLNVECETNSMSRICSEVRKDISHSVSPAGPSVADDSHLRGPLLEKEQKLGSRALAVARRRSCGPAELRLEHVPNENRWPRRMSFGDAEEAVFTWEEVTDVTEAADHPGCMGAHAGAASHLSQLIDEIVSSVAPWAEGKVRGVERLNDGLGRDQAELQGVYRGLDETCRRVRHRAEALLGGQREALAESVKEVEVLAARLDYEINGLVQKVHDVQDSLQGFERQVEDLEGRAVELKVALETESWAHWVVRTLTGLGTGPNITREA